MLQSKLQSSRSSGGDSDATKLSSTVCTPSSPAPATQCARPSSSSFPAPAAQCARPSSSSSPAAATQCACPSSSSSPAPAAQCACPSSSSFPAPAAQYARPSSSSFPTPAVQYARPSSSSFPATAAQCARPSSSSFPAPAAEAEDYRKQGYCLGVWLGLVVIYSASDCEEILGDLYLQQYEIFPIWFTNHPQLDDLRPLQVFHTTTSVIGAVPSIHHSYIDDQNKCNYRLSFGIADRFE